MRCTSCKQKLPASSFYYYKSSRHGGRRRRQTQCRVCKNAIRNANCNASPTEYMKRAYQQLRYSRKKRDPHIQFDITIDSLLGKYDKQGGKCALSGIEMTNFRDGTGIKKPTNISIDRLDPSADYTDDNVQLVCHAINMMKGTLDDEEFTRLCRAVARHRNSS